MNLRQAQMKAKLAGLEFAMGAPGAAQAPGTPGTPTAPAVAGEAPVAGASAPTAPTDDSDDEDDDTPPSGSAPPATPAKPAVKPTAKAPVKAPAKVAKGTPPPLQPRRTETPPDPAAVSNEYRQWHTVALRAVKAGMPTPRFAAVAIPAEDYAVLASELARSTTPDAVRAAFARAKQREATPVKRLSSLSGADARHQQQTHPASQAVEAARHTLSSRALALFDEAAREGYHHAQA